MDAPATAPAPAAEAAPAAPGAAAAAPELVADPSGRAPMLIPSGWTVSVESNEPFTLLRVDETPGADDSPTLGILAQPVASGGTPQSVSSAVASALEGARQVSQSGTSNGSVLYVLAGTVNGVAAKLALVATADINQAYAAFFVAPAARFDAVGGADLLLAALGATAVVSPSPGARSAGAPDVASYQGQLTLLANKQPVPPARLVGSWSQGSGAASGDVYQSVVDGSLSYDAIGHGNHFVFRADGTYAYVHVYSHTYGSCRNQLRRAESGTYRVDGTTLALTPNGFEAALCSCCSALPAAKRHPKSAPRTYELAMHAGGDHMVLRGTCPELMVSCVGPEGQRYQREGFTRVR